ncbi:hypothetical protein [Pontiella sulfatireligans]|uniref:Uncharacterized protein n=1 Tax=Pontiella sulfatireligans TaxID=2750658 RepID=A0A6C2UVR9_9BACT|nr:hypothetical protein [Pontiella sulfatireligans]VGO23207.1 hypothetical protein SCARR_05314 [Pontiella sulfatireligans]
MNRKTITRLLLVTALACAGSMFKLRCTHCKGTGFHAGTNIVCIFCCGKGWK